MDPAIGKEMEGLTAEAQEIDEKIESLFDEGTTPEEIEETKRRAAETISRYDALLRRLGPDDRVEVQRSIGMNVEPVREKLALLNRLG